MQSLDLLGVTPEGLRLQYVIAESDWNKMISTGSLTNITRIGDSITDSTFLDNNTFKDVRKILKLGRLVLEV